MMMMDTSAAGMRRAIEENLWQTWLALCHAPRVELIESEEMVRFATGLPLPPFNAVMRTRLDERNADRAIEQARAYFAAKKLPWTWYVKESAKPADLAERLLAHGLVEEAPEPGMALDLGLLPKTVGGPEGHAIEKVTAEELGGEYTTVLAAGFGMPDEIARGFAEIISDVPHLENVMVSGYLGRLKGVAVATSMLVAAGGVAGIYNVATLSEYRGRGIGAALTVAPLIEATELGYRIGSLQSSAMGYRVYERLGFREYCRIKQFVGMPS
jgi:GNAT superfamily N-acetyltransferase